MCGGVSEETAIRLGAAQLYRENNRTINYCLIIGIYSHCSLSGSITKLTAL